MRIDIERGLFLVADGMGGHGHGDVASRITVGAIADYVEKELDRRQQDQEGQLPEAGSEVHLMESAIQAGHRSVVGAVAEDQALLGMGTTVVALLAGDDTAVVAHVGDSRAYRLRSGELELVTEDHTWVNEQVKAGYLSQDQARTHPLKSVVTRAVGGDHRVEVDACELTVDRGDLYLLCSDGLTSMLTDDEIREHLTAKGDLEERCHRLVDDANDHGGIDNITVILLQALPDD